MNWFFLIRKRFAISRRNRARRALIREQKRMASYDCGRALYNQISNGRLAAAERFHIDTCKAVDRLMGEQIAHFANLRTGGLL